MNNNNDNDIQYEKRSINDDDLLYFGPDYETRSYLSSVQTFFKYRDDQNNTNSQSNSNTTPEMNNMIHQTEPTVNESARLLICIRGQNLESLNDNQNNRLRNNSEYSDDIITK